MSRSDVATVAAIAVLAYGGANVIHEGVGHGGACLLTGCTPKLLTSMTFTGNDAGLSHLSIHLISAGGTLANLAAGALALLLLRTCAPEAQARWFFLWLFAAINLFQASGYLLFSGLANLGDWAAIVHDSPHRGLWRIALAATGGAGYWFAADFFMKRLAARIPGIGALRLPLVYRHVLVAYFSGAALYVIAGSFDPAGPMIRLISGVAASLGGTSGFAWGPQFLRDATAGPYTGPELLIARDARWFGAAAILAALFAGVLGPGVYFSS